MYKPLLIHNDNSPISEIADVSIVFSPHVEELRNSDIDSYISNVILPQIKNSEFDVILIKDKLSENYIDFFGLILAYHIRLSREFLKEKSMSAIIILSDIDILSINKITLLGRVFFTKNIFIAANKKETLQLCHMELIQNLNEQEYQNKFLNLIEIEPPEDSNNHSIANEWAIYQWSKLLGITSDLIVQKMSKVTNSLYFKYLKSKYSLQDKSKNDAIKLQKFTGKVLLVDDKWADGWKDVIESFVSKHYDNVICDTLEWAKKDLTLDDLKANVSEKIKSCDPDVVLLDLRLLNNEENNTKISKISGIQILKYIREECKESINQGIQIIIFSASGDSLIVEEAAKYGTIGYVKKDSPINRYIASKGSFGKLDQLIKDGIERKHLKEIWNIRQSILLLPIIRDTKLSLDEDNNKIYELKNNVNYVFDILNSNLPQPNLYAMYAIFKCLELIIDMYIWEEKRSDGFCAIWKESNKQVDGFNSTENKIKKIMEQKLNLVNQEINDEIKKIVCCRNYSIHGGEKPNCRNVTIKNEDLNETHILKWFEMLLMILVKMDK